jgi:hypothetical protein
VERLIKQQFPRTFPVGRKGNAPTVRGAIVVFFVQLNLINLFVFTMFCVINGLSSHGWEDIIRHSLLIGKIELDDRGFHHFDDQPRRHLLE